MPLLPHHLPLFLYSLPHTNSHQCPKITLLTVLLTCLIAHCITSSAILYNRIWFLVQKQQPFMEAAKIGFQCQHSTRSAETFLSLFMYMPAQLYGESSCSKCFQAVSVWELKQEMVPCCSISWLPFNLIRHLSSVAKWSLSHQPCNQHLFSDLCFLKKCSNLSSEMLKSLL